MDSNNLRLFYAGFPAVDMTHTPKNGGAPVAGRAIFDQPGMSAIGGEMIGVDYSIRYPVVAFQEVRRGDHIDIGSARYTVREAPQPTLDGMERIALLEKS